MNKMEKKMYLKFNKGVRLSEGMIKQKISCFKMPKGDNKK